ncbi:hypothetical protein GKZ89_11295 [Bacillus mangrovi]|uniref:DUF4901 domain-containing protein n=1 Tax=Metabacillus mangrovi TaxID=1491830 RepID=A0A7X2S5V7_9BACI|nr:hypothetical protein [Metabacillus mangrovi]MTH53992.1 hypothetical protein [Metabacillus mangrovi]
MKQNEILDQMIEEFRLRGFTPGEATVRRELKVNRETHYFLSVGWYPEGTAPDEEELNPDGTIFIEYHLNSGKYTSFLIVGGCDLRNNPAALQAAGKEEAIRWAERKTGLTYKEHFILSKEAADGEEIEYKFTKTYDGTPIFMQGLFSLTLKKDGTIIGFQLEPGYPDKTLFSKAAKDLQWYENTLLNQLVLLPYPDAKQKAYVQVYAVEEVFLNENGTAVLPFEFSESRMLGVYPEKILTWNKTESAITPFVNKRALIERDLPEWEDALRNKPHPDAAPITDGEEESVIQAAAGHLQKYRPDESGKWILRNICRDHSRLTAHLYPVNPSALFEKLVYLLEGTEIVHEIDTSMMNEALKEFASPAPVAVSKKEAAENLRPHVLTKPYWVWDSKTGLYQKLWMLDSKHLVLAASGEIISENDLL